MKWNKKVLSTVRLYRSVPHPCSYKSGEQAETVFVDPDLVITKSLTSKMSELGYRRSGTNLYRPGCQLCQACIASRVPVELFHFSHSQKRIMRRNNGLRVVEQTDLTSDTVYALYSKYINTRHLDGDMYPATRDQFETFIKSKMVSTRFHLFYDNDRLIMVSVVDQLEQGLSAVYTFYDTDFKNRSLGRYSILWQIARCQNMGLPYLFLGYWIKDCDKMHYKISFRPVELLLDGQWVLAD